MTRLRIILGLTLLVFAATGCAGKRTRDTPRGESSAGEVTPPVGPMGPGGAQQTPSGGSQAFGPQPEPGFVPPKEGYVVLLGPGLARTVAYLGVLGELEARQVPIQAIVGVEMGAMIGGLWASANMNSAEWEMHKFKRQTLLDVPLLGLRGSMAEGKKLSAFLEEALKVPNLQKMRVPIVVVSSVKGSRSAEGEGLLAENSGSAKDVIRGAMSIPGFLRPYSWEGKERLSAAMEAPFPVPAAKGLGLGKVLCVDAIGTGDNFDAKSPEEQHLAALMRSVAAIARQQRKDCDAVISVPTDGVGYLDFDAKAELLYQGRMAVRKWLGIN